MSVKLAPRRKMIVEMLVCERLSGASQANRALTIDSTNGDQSPLVLSIARHNHSLVVPDEQLSAVV